jgi:hypothetical protein
MRGTGRLGSTHFSLAKHTHFIQSHGTQAAIFPCEPCSCQSPTRHADPNCFACGGTGRSYPPSLHFGTHVLTTREQATHALEETGLLMTGTMRATILPGVHLAMHDMVRLVDMVDTFNDEVLTRGLDDTVRFSGSVRLERVADRRTLYTQGRDYVLTPPATIAWVAGGLAPADGALYSVRYTANPDFLVVPDDPRIRVEARIAQSQVVTLRRLDKLTDSDLGYGGAPLE